MKNITKAVIIVALTIHCFAAGCIVSETTPTYEPTPEIVYVTTSTPTPHPNVSPTPEYTKIWAMTVVNTHLYDDYGNHIDSGSFSNELTVPYTEYDWTDDSTTMDDVFTAAGIDYDYYETISEKYGYPATDKYTMTGQYRIYGDGYILTMSMVLTATRY